MSACDRAMVYMTYLNDVTEGGGTMFYHQNVTTKAVKGKTLIFLQVIHTYLNEKYLKLNTNIY